MKKVNGFVLVAMACAFVGFGSLESAWAAGNDDSVVLKRSGSKPAGKAQTVPEEKYPFSSIARQMKNLPASGASSVEQAFAASAAIPPDWQALKDVALPPSAKVAVVLAAKVADEDTLPTPGPDGKVVYTFGVGQPTLVATPLQVCSIELQPGEKILGEPQIGDSVRWVVTPIMSGSGDSAVPILVVKPKLAGLSTTMIVATDRRTYYLRLISKPSEYISRIGFTYSDDQQLQWKLFLEKQQKEHEEKVDEDRVAITGNRAIDSMYFAYSFKVKSGTGAIVPERVIDDGEKTYIIMPHSTASLELPTLVVEGAEGNEMVNFRVKGTTYIVDRLFSKAGLVIGVGKHAEMVEIRRREPLTAALPKSAEVK